MRALRGIFMIVGRSSGGLLLENWSTLNFAATAAGMFAGRRGAGN
jgi:hypothetical protein